MAERPVLTSPGSARPLGAAEERALLLRVHQHGDAAARSELVERLLPFVRRVARSYSGRGEPFEDLVQVGAIGLVNAIDRFDLDRGLRLSTFAAPNISGEIKRHFRDRAWALRTPRDLQELHALVRSNTSQFLERHGRSPTVAELCGLTGHNEEQILDAIAAGRNYSAVSLDAPRESGPDGADDGDGRSLGERLGSDDRAFDHADDRDLLERSLSVLGARERQIVLLRYVDELTQREIAERVGVSQMHVSRLLRRSIDDMRAALS